MCVNGKYVVNVEASSTKEAVDLANTACQEADFGNLEDIDWEPAMIEPVGDEQ